MGRKTLRAAFPASPVYQRQQLAAMSVKGIEPDCTEIAMSLIETARNPVQKEWAYYWNHARFLQRGTYSISAFQLWIEHYPNSYLVPEQLAAVTARAVYDGKPEIASEACGIAYAACGNSLTVARQVGANLGTWLRYACDKAIKDETTAKATVRRKGAKAIERDASAMANAQANCIDEAQTGRTSLGAIYYNALTWSSAIDFRTKRGQSPKQILRSKEYFSGFFYYYGMAYKNDR